MLGWHCLLLGDYLFRCFCSEERLSGIALGSSSLRSECRYGQHTEPLFALHASDLDTGTSACAHTKALTIGASLSTNLDE
jgi:hypothetical protein